MSDITTRAREMLAAATPGPWHMRSGITVTVEAVSKARGMRPCGDPYPLIAKMPKSYADDHANAALIAAAPELIAALCAALEVAEAERDALRADVERLRARKAEMCGCVNYAESVANYTQDGCPKCGGSGAVFVEGGK